MEIGLAQPTLLLTAPALFLALPAIGLPSRRSLVRRGEPILRSMEVGFPLVEPRGPLLQILCRRGELAARDSSSASRVSSADRSAASRGALILQARSARLEFSIPRLRREFARASAAAADRCSCRSASTFA